MVQLHALARLAAVLVPTGAVLLSHPMRPDGGAPGLYAQYDWPEPKGVSKDMRVDHTVSPTPTGKTHTAGSGKLNALTLSFVDTALSSFSHEVICLSFAITFAVARHPVGQRH